jgi:hypothetical protein
LSDGQESKWRSDGWWKWAIEGVIDVTSFDQGRRYGCIIKSLEQLIREQAIDQGPSDGSVNNKRLDGACDGSVDNWRGDGWCDGLLLSFLKMLKLMLVTNTC